METHVTFFISTSNDFLFFDRDNQRKLLQKLKP